MLCLPYLSEASLTDDVQIVEHAFFNPPSLSQTYCAFHILATFSNLVATVLGVLLRLLVGEVLGVFEVEAGVLLGVDQKVVSKFVVKVAEFEIREIVFR